jgi:hypothetical protein
MKRFLCTLAVIAVCLAPLHADLTLSQTITIEGGMAAMMGGMQPKMTTRIKGLKARMDVDVMNQQVSTITDLDKKQVAILNGMTKTATIVDATSMGGPSSPMPMKMPNIDLSFKPTGQSRTIDGVKCDEHQFAMTMNMAETGGGQMPPEAVAAMKDVRMVMNGSVWIATSGAAVGEYMAFQKAATAATLGWALSAVGGPPGGQQGGGLDKLMNAASSAPGLPYLTELTMSFEGTGPMVDMMKKMGAMKMTQKIVGVSTDSLSDDLFVVPADYKIEKK